jgi:hypothetical protein
MSSVGPRTVSPVGLIRPIAHRTPRDLARVPRKRLSLPCKQVGYESATTEMPFCTDVKDWLVRMEPEQ